MKARKFLTLVAFAAVVAAFHLLDLGKYLTLESLKANRASLEALRTAHLVLFPAFFVLIYIVQTAFSLPGAAILSLAAGAIFGPPCAARMSAKSASSSSTWAFQIRGSAPQSDDMTTVVVAPVPGAGA